MPKENKKDELHELEAERNALLSLINHSLADAVAHLEHVTAALLLMLDKGEHGEMHKQLDKIETLEPEELGVVKLFGEETHGDVKEKSKREEWHERLVEVEKQIAEYSETATTSA